PRLGACVAGLDDDVGGLGGDMGARVRRGDPGRDDRALVALTARAGVPGARADRAAGAPAPRETARGLAPVNPAETRSFSSALSRLRSRRAHRSTCCRS